MKLTASASVLGFLAVALGAFGAHGLEGSLGAQEAGWWETATFYVLVHSALAACLGPDRARAGWCFVAGAAVFGGTLYAMALGAPSWLGMVTPLGGVLLLLGWGVLFVSALRR